MNMLLEAIGTALPPHFIAKSDAAGVAQQLFASSCEHPQVLAKLYQRSGVRTRHSVVLRTSTNGAPAEQAFYRPACGADDLGPTTAERMHFYEHATLQLAARACSDALTRASADAHEVTHLMTASCTGCGGLRRGVWLERAGLAPVA